MQDSGVKRNNDPWIPLALDSTSNLGAFSAPPENPHHQLIDSDKYIKTLEAKLKKLTKARQNEPTSRDIINSLAIFRDDQMRRFVDDDNATISHISEASSNSDLVEDHTLQNHYVLRKLHPERQPLNAEEIAELVKEDVMAKAYEDLIHVEERLELSTVTAFEPEKETPLATNIPTSSSNTNSIKANSSQGDNILKNAERTTPTSSLNDHEKENLETENAETENWANFDEMDREVTGN